MLGPGTCLQTELEVGEGLGRGASQEGGRWVAVMHQGCMWRVEAEWSRPVGPTHRALLSTFQEQIRRRARWDLGWSEACFRVSAIRRSVEAKDGCFRAGTLRIGVDDILVSL